MIQPESEPVHDTRHAHVDMGDLMDASSRGPSEGDAGTPVDTDVNTDAHHDVDGDVDTSRDAGGDGEEVDVTGQSSDAYISGQDAGSID